MDDYTRKAKMFLIDQGIPDKEIYVKHKMWDKYSVYLSHILTQYEDYLKGYCEEDMLENVEEALRNAGSIK